MAQTSRVRYRAFVPSGEEADGNERKQTAAMARWWTQRADEQTGMAARSVGVSSEAWADGDEQMGVVVV